MMGGVLGLIPARGGSVGIPRKNLADLEGRPLIAYAIASGLASQGVDRLIVSTDDDEIAAVARRFGAEVPFRRPPVLAADDTPDLPVFLHALRWLDANDGYRPEWIVQLRPTSPLRPRGLVDEGIAAIRSDPVADSVRSVAAAAETPYKMYTEDRDGFLAPLLRNEVEASYDLPRQQLPPVLCHSGHLDVVRTACLIEQGSISGRRIRPLFVERRFCTDIDTPDDLDLARYRFASVREAIDLPATPDAEV